MTFNRFLLISILGSSFIFTAQAANAKTLKIDGGAAKALYNSLTGPAVQQDGAAGHLYRRGTSILCRYIDVDMSYKGKPVPMNSSMRYACSITFDNNGLASPGPNP
ncbi:MAG: hypothetical protein EPO11_04770 [Gammaproteobacteria bacterium]|nr:MAG: hypothetical protein EPO11_04770 [Gammaproteobacteria bacterium]